jgi:hypothetical protein
MESGVVDVVEAVDACGCVETIVKHQGRIKRLLKALKRAVAKCCATQVTSSGDEQPPS